MAFAEWRDGVRSGGYYRGRYQRPDGKLDSVRDADGKVVRFRNRRKAEKAARDTERDEAAKAEKGKWVARERGRITLREYALGREDDDTDEGWLGAQDLAASTIEDYQHSLTHILPAFGETPIGDLEAKAIDAWERKEKETGAVTSVTGYRKILHLILEDAVDEGIRADNPAKRRRNRGKRAGRSSSRGPEKKITDSLGILLLAERAALLAGRDDEFVATVATGYTGMRWGEVVGLAPQFVREEVVRVEQQLYELNAGRLLLCPPKDDSYRYIDTPTWMTGLLAGQAARTSSAACSCHEKPFVFRGRGTGRKGSRTGPTMADVAKEAGVSTGTVSNVLNRPDGVRAATRVRVEKAVAELGFVRGGTVVKETAHWRRSGYATWIFTPAATGWYPPKAPQPRRPVPIVAEPWPGVPARGKGAVGRATGVWEPIQDGLTRHGLRHTHRTILEEIGAPKVLMDERLGHIDGSVSARYAHVTEKMRSRLVADLTELWEASLDARREMSPRSPVPTLDALLNPPEA